MKDKKDGYGDRVDSCRYCSEGEVLSLFTPSNKISSLKLISKH